MAIVAAKLAELVALGRQPGMTIRKLYQTQAGASGHCVFVGTPTEAADLMQDWFESRGCDGWNLIPPSKRTSTSRGPLGVTGSVRLRMPTGSLGLVESPGLVGSMELPGSVATAGLAATDW